ncbi:MAG: rRNA methyltransferase [Candidatus Dojkabacteria bacterium]|nr:MAG: rRNA methyltransferase [Candidatus Dojkabacteria bacterium]
MQKLSKKEIKKIFKHEQRSKLIHVVAENIQYAKNVASIFRICDAGGVSRLYLTGISHTPPFGKELRKVSRNKEKSVEWHYFESSVKLLSSLKSQGFKIIAIELCRESFPIQELRDKIKPFDKICLVVGNEVYGVTSRTLDVCDMATVIPMYGKGASLNVTSSLAIALFNS